MGHLCHRDSPASFSASPSPPSDSNTHILGRAVCGPGGASTRDTDAGQGDEHFLITVTKPRKHSKGGERYLGSEVSVQSQLAPLLWPKVKQKHEGGREERAHLTEASTQRKSQTGRDSGQQGTCPPRALGRGFPGRDTEEALVLPLRPTGTQGQCVPARFSLATQQCTERSGARWSPGSRSPPTLFRQRTVLIRPANVTPKDHRPMVTVY